MYVTARPDPPPFITVTCDDRDPFTVADGEIVDMIVPPNVQVDCDWALTAFCRDGWDFTAYGGVLAGYRYGWDIIDLNDPDQWSIEFTPFISGPPFPLPTRAFAAGTHVLHYQLANSDGETLLFGIRFIVQE